MLGSGLRAEGGCRNHSTWEPFWSIGIRFGGPGRAPGWSEKLPRMNENSSNTVPKARYICTLLSRGAQKAKNEAKAAKEAGKVPPNAQLAPKSVQRSPRDTWPCSPSETPGAFSLQDFLYEFLYELASQSQFEASSTQGQKSD